MPAPPGQGADLIGRRVADKLMIVDRSKWGKEGFLLNEEWNLTVTMNAYVDKLLGIERACHGFDDDFASF